MSKFAHLVFLVGFQLAVSVVKISGSERVASRLFSLQSERNAAERNLNFVNQPAIGRSVSMPLILPTKLLIQRSKSSVELANQLHHRTVRNTESGLLKFSLSLVDSRSLYVMSKWQRETRSLFPSQRIQSFGSILCRNSIRNAFSCQGAPTFRRDPSQLRNQATTTEGGRQGETEFFRPDDEKDLWLEDVDSPEALKWVTERNSETIGRIVCS